MYSNIPTEKKVSLVLIFFKSCEQQLFFSYWSGIVALEWDSTILQNKCIHILPFFILSQYYIHIYSNIYKFGVV